MSTANIMSGLLSASGLRERLQEFSGKTSPLPSGFPQAESYRTKDSSGNEGFTSQFDRLTREALPGDLSGLERPDGEKAEAEAEAEVDMTVFAGDAMDEYQEADHLEDSNEVETIAAVENAADAVAVVKTEEDAGKLGDVDQEHLADPEGGEEAETAADADDRALSESSKDETPNAALPATAETGRPTELSAQQTIIPVAVAGDRQPVPAESEEKVSAAENSKVAREELYARRDDVSAIRVDGRMAERPAQAFNRYVANDLFQRPVTANDTHAGQRAAEGMMRSGRAGPTPGDVPLVTVGGFKMSSEQPAQPGNFLEKFSRQLDMMRPVFRALPGSDGLGKALEAGGQVMAPQVGHAASGTIPQVQQAIQTSLVNLATESTTNGPVAKTMELSLLPRSLGEIRIHMVHSGSQISVEITTNTVAATHAMETAKNDIVKAYLQFGIQPDDVNIRVTETRDATQPSLPTGSDQDRSSQASGQGLARNGNGSSMAERQENAGHRQEEEIVRTGQEEGLKQAETAKPVRSGVMGKVQYF